MSCFHTKYISFLVIFMLLFFSLLPLSASAESNFEIAVKTHRIIPPEQILNPVKIGNTILPYCHSFREWIPGESTWVPNCLESGMNQDTDGMREGEVLSVRYKFKKPDEVDGQNHFWGHLSIGAEQNDSGIEYVLSEFPGDLTPLNPGCRNPAGSNGTLQLADKDTPPQIRTVVGSTITTDPALTHCLVEEGKTYYLNTLAVNCAQNSTETKRCIPYIIDHASSVIDIVALLATADEINTVRVPTLDNLADDSSYILSLTSGEGDRDNSFFEFDKTEKNKLILKKQLDYEQKSEYSIRVLANNGTERIEQIFLIPVEDKNEPITDLLLETNAISENVPVNSEISKLRVVDPDASGNYTYRLIEALDANGDPIPNDNTAFLIEGDRLQNRETFSFRDKSEYKIRVGVDDGIFNLEKDFTLTVINENNPPQGLNIIAPDMTSSKIVVGDLENAGQLVGHIIATDPDEDDLTYSIIYGQGDSFFKIEQGNQLMTKIVFDASEKNLYKVGIRASDGVSDVIKVFDIVVRDVNRPPALFSLKNNTIDENTVGLVGEFLVQDHDDIEFLFEIVEGFGDQDNALFEIKNGNQLHTREVINFEEHSVLSVRVRTTDSAGNHLEEVFVVYVNDTREHCDKLLSQECSALMNLYDLLGGTPENLNWRDPDMTRWSSVKVEPLLIERNGIKSIENRIIEIKASGLKLKGSLPDTISNLSHLRTLDLSNNQIEGLLPASIGELSFLETLNLSNNQIESEIPENFGQLQNLKTLALSHNKIFGSLPEILGNLKNLEYFFVFQNNLSCTIPNRFTELVNLRPNYGLRIHQNHLLIEEDNLDLYNFLFEKSYKGNLDFTSQKNPRCGSVPSNIELSPATISENNFSGQVIGMLSTVDLDSEDTFTYQLTFGDGVIDNNFFTIEGDQLKANETFDYEKKSVYEIRVQSKDGFNTFSQNLTVNIEDQDRPITDIKLAPNFLLDRYFADQKILDFLIEDDNESPLRFVFPETVKHYFEIRDNTLVAKRDFDLKTQTALEFQLEVSDKNSKFAKDFHLEIKKDSDSDGTADEDENGSGIMNPCLPDPLAQGCLLRDIDHDGLPDLADLDPKDPCKPNVGTPACRDKWGDLYGAIYDGSLSIGTVPEVDPNAEEILLPVPALSGGASTRIYNFERNSCGKTCQAEQGKKNSDFTIRVNPSSELEERVLGSFVVFKIGDKINFTLPPNQPRGDYYVSLKNIGINRSVKLGTPILIEEGRTNGAVVSFSVQAIDKHGRLIRSFKTPPIKIDNVPPPIYGEVGEITGGSGPEGAFLEGDTLVYKAPITGDRFELDLGSVGGPKFLQSEEGFHLKNIEPLYGNPHKTFVTAIDKAGNKRVFHGPTLWFGSVGNSEKDDADNINNTVLEALKKLKQSELDKKARAKKRFNPYSY